MATTVAQHSVATFTSPVNGTTPIDANTVRGNDNTTRAAYNDHDADPGIHVQSSTLASRPVAGTAGRKWITEDSGVYTLWFDDGTNWHPVSSENVALTVLAGENLVKGDVVKVTGWNNGQDLPEVVKTTSAADTAFAVITATVSSGSMGYATNTGIVQDVNTAAYSVGTILYANGSGGFTSTKPTSGNYQPVAYVLRANASNGVYYVEFSTPRIVERSDNTASTVVLRDSNGDFSAGTITATAVNATTLDLTNLEVTNIKAKDGTQAIAIADTTGKLTISDGVLLSALTASQAVFTDGSKNLVSNAITGTGNVVMSASPTLTGTVTAATLNATTLGGTLSTAAQPNVTSVGTLQSLTVSGDITAAAGSATDPSITFAGYTNFGFGIDGTGIRVVSGGAGSATTFTTSGISTDSAVISGNLTVDTNTLFVDAVNNRVGVGTASPSNTLHVAGVGQITGDTYSGTHDGAKKYYFERFASGAPNAYFVSGSADNNSRQGFIFQARNSDGLEYPTVIIEGYSSTSTTTPFHLDASGNLGLGVTPSAWVGGRWMQFLSTTAIGQQGNGTANLVCNAYESSSNSFSYIAAAAAARYNVQAGSHAWYVAPSGTAGNAITFTQAMTLDASGNLLVGPTSSSYRLHVSSNNSTAYSTSDFDSPRNLLLQNANTTTSANIGLQFLVGGNSEAAITAIRTADGEAALAFGTRSAGSRTERARIDASGNLLVGTTSNAAITGFSGSAIGQTIQSVLPVLALVDSDNTSDHISWIANSGGLMYLNNKSANAMVFSTNNTERARITSGGFAKHSNTGTYSSSTNDRHEFSSDKNDLNVLFNNTNTGASVSNVYSNLAAGVNAAAFHFAGAISGSGLQFTVDADGDVKNTNSSYGAISDLKLKQDIVDAASQWDDIKAVRVRKYRFKRTPDAPLQIGVIAQELEAVSPGLVDEVIDRDDDGHALGTTTKAVKYSILYMKSVKALQEAMARIETLEARVAALEA